MKYIYIRLVVKEQAWKMLLYAWVFNSFIINKQKFTKVVLMHKTVAQNIKK